MARAFSLTARWPGAFRRASNARPVQPGAVRGGVRTLLRLEGAAILAASLAAYASTGAGWGAFALLFLLPDLSLVAYLRGPRLGAQAYNAAHSMPGPIALVAGGALAAQPVLLAVGLVWAAHIGMDRMLGFGLKYEVGFADTHLGRVGNDPW